MGLRVRGRCFPWFHLTTLMGIPKATPAHWAARGGKWQILQCLKEALDRWCNDVRCEPQLGGCHICFVGKRNTWTQLAGTSFRKLVAGCWNIHVSNWHYPGDSPVPWLEPYRTGVTTMEGTLQICIETLAPNLTPAKGRCESGGRGSAQWRYGAAFDGCWGRGSHNHWLPGWGKKTHPFSLPFKIDDIPKIAEDWWV